MGILFPVLAVKVHNMHLFEVGIKAVYVDVDPIRI
jgi:hypothetical protein